MPIYTCTVRESTLTADTKLALAREMGRIHSSVNHVPSTYVNVAFHEPSADSVYTACLSPGHEQAWIAGPR